MRHKRYSVLALVQKKHILMTNAFIPWLQPLFLWNKLPLFVKIRV
ncbi:hypothetical protein Q5C_08405 [Leuconostoc pseudomesenteroides 4882]|nr:hypothetical protein Q5C_08405 [Leuconostoc pseudomesenteroides 4882]